MIVAGVRTQDYVIAYIKAIRCYNRRDMSDKKKGGGPRAPVPVPVRRALRQLSGSVLTWRKLRGLTQAELADRAGVTHTTVRRLEHGEGGVSIENLLRILRALGVLDALPRALDPYETDVGRLRADEHLPRRVNRRDLTGESHG